MLGFELLSIFLEELIPFLLFGRPLGRVLMVEIINLLRHDKRLLRIEAEFCLHVFAVIRFQGVPVNTAGALKLGAEANGRCQLDHGRLVFHLLGPLDSSLNPIKIVIAILDPFGVPSVRLKSFKNVFGKGLLRVTICLWRQPPSIPRSTEDNIRGTSSPIEMWLSS